MHPAFLKFAATRTGCSPASETVCQCSDKTMSKGGLYHVALILHQSLGNIYVIPRTTSHIVRTIDVVSCGKATSQTSPVIHSSIYLFVISQAQFHMAPSYLENKFYREKCACMPSHHHIEGWIEQAEQFSSS